MNKGIKIDQVTNTITLPKSFYEASLMYDSSEQAELAEIRQRFPDMRIIVRTHRCSSFTSNTKGLTYEYMRKFIRHMDKKNIATFEETIAHFEDFGYSSGQVYQCVKNWFLDHYPRHNEMVVESAPSLVA